MTRKYLDLAVLEGRYWSKENDSIKPAFDLLANVHQWNPNYYHYEMFNNSQSLEEILLRVTKKKTVHHVYIASHGCKTTITGSDGKPIPFEEISNILEKISDQNLYGIYFGSCLFGEQTCTLMKESNTTWIAGYTTSVDWMSAALLDLFFWNTYPWSDIHHAQNESIRAEIMFEFLFTLFRRVPLLFEEMGLRVSVRYKGSIVTFLDDVFQMEAGIRLENSESLLSELRLSLTKILKKKSPYGGARVK